MTGIEVGLLVALGSAITSGATAVLSYRAGGNGRVAEKSCDERRHSCNRLLDERYSQLANSYASLVAEVKEIHNGLERIERRMASDDRSAQR